MCRICSSDPQEERSGRDEAKYIAEDLKELSALFTQLAYNDIKPHSEKAKSITIRARNCLRHLVEWI